jgi:hypothetical protein
LALVSCGLGLSSERLLLAIGIEMATLMLWTGGFLSLLPPNITAIGTRLAAYLLRGRAAARAMVTGQSP